ncbi:MAG TPA: hypothetical protein VLT59_00830, partial [Steroidobacteraceae bacterium]|nr:hypothetical protein [Steroidobacteraceae bacterium]
MLRLRRDHGRAAMEVTNVIELRTRTDWQRTASSRRRTPAPPARPLTQTEVVDAAARVLLRRGYQGLLFGGVARELGVATRSVIAVISDKPELVRACYRRTVAALEMGLMLAETSTGAGIQKLDAFLGSMLEIRRERGCLLPIALAEGPSTADIRWCR